MHDCAMCRAPSMHEHLYALSERFGGQNMGADEHVHDMCSPCSARRTRLKCTHERLRTCKQVIGVNNPGTPESALIDMRLLSECNELVVTVGSSYGSIAAGMGGIAPVQMIHGKHQNVQVGVTSPCQHVVSATMCPGFCTICLRVS